MLTDAEDDIPAFNARPAEHWTKLRSTNPLERQVRHAETPSRRIARLPLETR